MLPDERKHYILERLKRDGRIIAKTLSEELALSEDTIRRDLREMASDGLLQRVHGGALPASPALSTFEDRLEIASDAKIAIGRYAANMIGAGQVVILDGGTTATQIARHLPPDLAVTIVTHSPGIAMELVNHHGSEVILIGGKLYKHSIVAVGSAALTAIRQIHADIYFMGVTGIHPKYGLSTGDYEEAHIKNALRQQAAETFVLASPEKLGAVSACVVCSPGEVSGLIVDASVTDAKLQAFYRANFSIRRADAP